ncbi:MAG: hypothetical protein RR194_02740 [Ruthenibacterium sp.]
MRAAYFAGDAGRAAAHPTSPCPFRQYKKQTRRSALQTTGLFYVPL